MLVLFETAAGFALFKVKDESKLDNLELLQTSMQSSSGCKKLLKLIEFNKFSGMEQALKSATRMIEGKVSKKLKRMLTKCQELSENKLAVADNKIGSVLNEKLSISCVTSPAIQELMRGIREHLNSLLPDVDSKEFTTMSLGLAHSCSRHKVKFNPDRIDTMIIQGINLLDDIDKEVNNYIMRCREWYGWHFPELEKLITDNLIYVKVLKKIRHKHLAEQADLSDIVDNNLISEIRAAAAVSMGTDITDEDMEKITTLCDQIIQITDYRANLLQYITNRMQLVAPNLSILVGEVVGARLIAHAGSLMNLSKQPSSTVQVLGAEKALFNALKTRKNTPKFGLIYHASLVSKAPLKHKGKMSRSLAAKCALAIRCDALSEQEVVTQHTMKMRVKLEKQLSLMEQNANKKINLSEKTGTRFEKYTNKSTIYNYNTAADSTVGKKRKFEAKTDEQNDGNQLDNTNEDKEVTDEVKENKNNESTSNKQKKKSSHKEML